MKRLIGELLGGYDESLQGKSIFYLFALFVIRRGHSLLMILLLLTVVGCLASIVLINLFAMHQSSTIVEQSEMIRDLYERNKEVEVHLRSNEELLSKTRSALERLMESTGKMSANTQKGEMERKDIIIGIRQIQKVIEDLKKNQLNSQ